MIGSAILLGISLSLLLIGPIFFLLIETSLTKGVRPAIALESGVIAADITCIIISFYSSQELLDYIKEHPFLYTVGGLIIFVYGIHSYTTKARNVHIKQNINVVSNNYFITFFNGYLLNFLNIGVIVFWLTTTIWISSHFPSKKEFFSYISLVMLTMLAIDLAKIFLANTFKHKMTDTLILRIKKIVGIILMIFGVIIFLKGFSINIIPEF